MDRNITDKIEENLFSTLFYHPLKNSANVHTTYRLDATHPSIQPLFQSPAKSPINYQASTSHGTEPIVNSVQSSMPPPTLPLARKSIALQFNKTIVIGKERECQLCDRAYKNKRHQTLYREKNICCICRRQFMDKSALVQHVDETIKAKICCLCKLPLSDDRETNEYHFKHHK